MSTVGRSDTGIGQHSGAGYLNDLVFLVAAPLKKERELADILIKLSQLLQMQRIRALLRSSKSPDEMLEVLAKVLDWREEPADVDENGVSTY